MVLKELVKRALPISLLDLLRSYRYSRRRMKTRGAYQEVLKHKSGIEIGGPSLFFRHTLPIYPVISSLDGVNFSNKTLWEGEIWAGRHFEFSRGRKGYQYIGEATDLAEIQTGRYQFLLSSNCLEHVANPLKALKEWVRVVEPGGLFLLVLPNPVSNFDHWRLVTTFEHLLEDEVKNMGEDDMTHLQEILALHDLARDPWAGGRENFIGRCRDNERYRGMHHHVFDLPLIEQMLSHVGVSVLQADVIATDFVVMGRTPS